MARRFRFVAVLALLVGAVTTVAACGGSDKPTAASLLKDAFGPNHSVKSGKLDVALELNAKGLQNINGPVALKLTGPFESQGKGKLPKLDLDLSIAGSGANFSAGAVSTGDKGYIKLQGTAFVVDDATFAKFKQQYEASASKSSGGGGQTLKSLGVDPLRWLTGAKIAGSENAGGTDTWRITSSVDVPKFLDDVSGLLAKAGSLGSATAQLPKGLSASQRQAIAASVKSAALQIWVGKDDKTLRRLNIAIGIDVPAAIRPRAGGLSTGTLSFDLQIADLNKPQTISAPANARPLSELKQLIANGATGASGASGGATSTTPPATSGGSSSSSGTGSKYLDCVNKAGNDVRAIQKCAALVGQ